MGLWRRFLCLYTGAALLAVTLAAQTTNTCFEIESILVDACAPENPSREGLNEMVRFLVGSNPLNTSNLSVTWASANSWKGVCRNSSTTAVVAQLNATIQSCGKILEPPGGIIPANKRVILVTSADMDVAYNSFAGLQDTVYMIFQCGSETAGHFGNYSGSPGIRTLSMNFGSGCSDQVSYDRTKLVDQNGNVGNGPSGTNLGDGSTVNFSFSGSATYVNYGCIAPITPLSAEWDVPPPVCASSGAFDLNAFVTGNAGGRWSGTGVSGSMFNPAGLNGAISVTYTVGPGNCSVQKTQNITVIPQSDASWNTPGTICSNAGTVNLNQYITGNTGGTWSGNGVSGSTFNPSGLNGSIAITYSVGIGACAANSTQQIEVSPNMSANWTNPGPLCDNAQPLNLNQYITGNTGGTWSGNGVSGSTFNPSGLNGSIAITYSVGTGACAATSTQNININQHPAAPAPINGRTNYCMGETTEPLTVQPANGATVQWFSDPALSNPLGTGNSITPQSGLNTTYYVTQQKDGCKSAATPVSVTFQPAPAAPVLPATVSYCEGSIPAPVTASGNGTIIWYSDAALSNEVYRGNTYTPSANLPASLFVISESGNCRSGVSRLNFEKKQSESVKISPTGPLVLCKNSSFTLTSSASTGNLWSTGETGNSIQVAQAGLYKVKVNGACNTATDSILVINGTVIAGFSMNPPGGEPPIDIQLTETSINASSSQWYLDGALFDPKTENYKLHFEEEGEHKLTLVVSNASGCTDSISKTIKLFSGLVTLYVPNTFSPNGDHVNDVFNIYCTGITEFTVYIFNRWGEEVSRFNQLNSGWDGTYKGKEVIEGVYVYRFNGLDVLGQKVRQIGRIHLIK